MRLALRGEGNPPRRCSPSGRRALVCSRLLQTSEALRVSSSPIPDRMSLRPQDTDTRVIVTVDEIDHSTVDAFDAELQRGLSQYAQAPHSRPDRAAGSL